MVSSVRATQISSTWMCSGRTGSSSSSRSMDVHQTRRARTTFSWRACFTMSCSQTPLFYTLSVQLERDF